jgi:8-oxo-dGTP diphosphatase
MIVPQIKSWPQRAVVALIAQNGRLLTIKRSETVRAPGSFCFPGGGIEPGESHEAAVRREIFEELGVTAFPIAPIWSSTSPSGVRLSWWQAKVEPSEAIQPNPAEVADYFWLTIPEIRELPNLLASNIQFLESLANGEFRLEW